MKHTLRKLLSFARNQQGLAYLEFALCAPFLLVLFMGSVEVTRYIIITQKVEKSSVTVSDVVSQSSDINVTQLDQLMLAVGEVMKPFSFDTNGYVIITSITSTSGAPAINWQHAGGGTWTHVSHVGVAGQHPIMPNGLVLNDKDTVIVAEVFYNYQPMIVNTVIAGKELYKLAIFKPRLGNLKTLGSS